MAVKAATEDLVVGDSKEGSMFTEVDPVLCSRLRDKQSFCSVSIFMIIEANATS